MTPSEAAKCIDLSKVGGSGRIYFQRYCSLLGDLHALVRKGAVATTAPSTAEIHSSKDHRVPHGVASCILLQRLGTTGLVIADPAGPTAASAV